MAYLLANSETPKETKPEQIVLGSSFLQVAEYDATNFVLTLHFKSKLSLIHRYFYPTTWEQFKLAPSAGSFYSTMIKGKYQAIPFHPAMKSSDITKAKKEHKLQRGN